MSKSLGNGILPSEIIEQYGADILRLWVASSDYQVDVRISPDILAQLSEAYRKIRNTARYILGNLADFDPDADAVPDEALEPIDRWALLRLDSLIELVRGAYEAFEFHRISHAIQNFCVVDMSNFYLDVLKDRLYTEKADGVARRAAQTVIFRVLDAMTRMLTPILAFTSEEIWQHMPHRAKDDPEAAIFNDFPEPSGLCRDEAFLAEWEQIHALREDVQKALELARGQKLIGKSLDAQVCVYCTGETFARFKAVEDQLATVCIVSQLRVVEGDGGEVRGECDGVSVTVAKADGEKCARCWTYSTTVGTHPEHPQLCARCAAILSE